MRIYNLLVILVFCLLLQSCSIENKIFEVFEVFRLAPEFKIITENIKSSKDIFLYDNLINFINIYSYEVEEHEEFRGLDLNNLKVEHNLTEEVLLFAFNRYLNGKKVDFEKIKKEVNLLNTKIERMKIEKDTIR